MFLYENEAAGLEQTAAVTMATRVLQAFKKDIFVHPPECLTASLKGGWKFSFPKMFDSYRLVLKCKWAPGSLTSAQP